MADEGISELLAEGIDESAIKTHFSVDLRYAGQSYTLNVPWSYPAKTREDYHQLHQKRYGHQHQQAVELVNIRVKVTASPLTLSLPEFLCAERKLEILEQRLHYGIDKPVPVYQRERLACGHHLAGPALIVERVSTTYLAPGWDCNIDTIGNLRLRKN